MATKKLSVLVLLFFPLLVLAFRDGELRGTEERQREARECRIESLSAVCPSRRMEWEGGITELWDELGDQFQCAGVGAMRNTIRPNSLTLPTVPSSPRLLYIERGQGLAGISFPECPETYFSRGPPKQAQKCSHHKEDETMIDQYQKVHRIRKGDVVAVIPGAAHWSYNDGNEDLVIFSIADLNSQHKLAVIDLAGTQPGEKFGGERSQSIIHGLDPKLLAESFNVSMDLAKRIQREDQRGLMVKVQCEGMGFIQPEEEEGNYSAIHGDVGNGLEENYCTMGLKRNIDDHEADIYSRQGGRLNIVNSLKLPILEQVGLSAEKGTLYPDAIFAPHWSMNSHTILYVTRGEGHVQVIGNKGRSVFNGNVKEGDLLVIPQYFVSLKKAGRNGLEWVAVKTSSKATRSAIVGSTSAFNGMPLQVLANSYSISNKEAWDLKYSRADQVIIFPPSTAIPTTSQTNMCC